MKRSMMLVASIAAMTGAAFAQQTPNPEPGAETAPNAKAEEVAIIDAKQVGTRDEAKLYAESEFKQADLNRDGKVDKDEFLAYATIRAPLQTSSSAKDQQSDAGDATETASAEEPVTADEQFAEISNGGEVISEDQLVKKRVAQFDEVDADGDAELTVEERMQYAQLTMPKAPKNAL